MHIRSLGFAGFLIGILFKVLHWPGANVIMLAGALLTLVAVVLLLVRSGQPLTIQVRRPALLFASVAVALFGVLFKMMHWPGANIMLLLGMSTFVVLFSLRSVITEVPAARV